MPRGGQGRRPGQAVSLGQRGRFRSGALSGPTQSCENFSLERPFVGYSHKFAGGAHMKAYENHLIGEELDAAGDRDPTRSLSFDHDPSGPDTDSIEQQKPGRCV